MIPGEEAYKNFNGWFAEYIKINAGGVVFNVSDMDLDLRTLIEPAAVTIHAVEKAKEIFNFKHNSYVLIQGCGPIGLLLLAVVRTMGVRNIIAGLCQDFFAKVKFSRWVAGSQPAMISDNRSSSSLKR